MKSGWLLFDAKSRDDCCSTLRVEGAASLLNGLGEVHGLASFPPPQEELRGEEDAGHQ